MNELVSSDGIEFYVTSEYTLDDLRRVQARSLEMFREIQQILDRHNIAYTLGYGSLLGQIRHGGYIPWDDDIDLFILSHDYARAILSLRRELPKNLLLHDKRNDPIYWVTWVKVRDLFSDTVESMWKIDQRLRYHGIAIDLIRVTQTTVGRKRHEAAIKTLTARRKRNRSRYGALHGMAQIKGTPRAAAVEVILGGRSFTRKVLKRLSRQKLLVAAPGTVVEQSFRKDDFLPISKDGPLFEGMQVNTPRNPEAVLRSMYGDFRSLPPIEDRVPHFESVKFLDEESDSPAA